MILGMPNTSDSGALFLCSGKSCAKKEQSAYEQLRSAARKSDLLVAPVGCQGSCEGPTAVLTIDGNYRWFERLQSKKSQQDLLRLATAEIDVVPKRLAKRELTGKQRAKAAGKLSRQLQT